MQESRWIAAGTRPAQWLKFGINSLILLTFFESMAQNHMRTRAILPWILRG